MNSLIDRQAAIEIIQNMYPGMPRVSWLRKDWQERYDPYIRVEKAIRNLPSAQPERHFCRECKWVKYHGRVDKYGNVESYWRCCNWDGETDEEGFCHEWEGTQ